MLDFLLGLVSGAVLLAILTFSAGLYAHKNPQLVAQMGYNLMKKQARKNRKVANAVPLDEENEETG